MNKQEFLIIYTEDKGYMMYTPYLDEYDVQCEALFGDEPVQFESIGTYQNYGNSESAGDYIYQTVNYGELPNGEAPNLEDIYSIIIRRHLDNGEVDTYIGNEQFISVDDLAYIGTYDKNLYRTNEDIEGEDIEEEVVSDEDLPVDKYETIHMISIDETTVYTNASDSQVRLIFDEIETNNIFNLYVASEKYFYNFDLVVNRTDINESSYFLEARDTGERVYIKNDFENEECINTTFEILKSLFHGEEITELKILLSKSEDQLIKELEGASLISFGREDLADHDITNNYGIAINSSDDYLALPARAISLFQTNIHPDKTIKVSYDFQGILGTLPDFGLQNEKVNQIYNNYMAGTQGIYTDNMYIGDKNQYIAFYEDGSGNKHLKISARELVYEIDEDSGEETTWEDKINDATQGIDGVNTATVLIYRRSNISPDTPSNSTYDFENGFTPPSGWYNYIPSGIDPCYVSSATVRSRNQTATLEWSIPIILVQNGQDGQPGPAGTAGVSIESIVPIYWLKENDDPEVLVPNNPITSTSTQSDVWTTVVPDYVLNGLYYTAYQTTLSNNTITFSEVILNSALTITSQKAYMANSAVSTLNQHFWWLASQETDESGAIIPPGAYITETNITNFKQNQIGFNLLTQSSGIFLRSGKNVLSSLTSTELAFYVPNTNTKILSIGSNGGLQSGDFSRGSGTFSDSGSRIDLLNGDIITKYFRVSNATSDINAGAYIYGTIEALKGRIGGYIDNGGILHNYWEIGNHTNYNLEESAKLIGHGSSFIQLGDTLTCRLFTNRIHSGWYTTGDSYLHFPKFNNFTEERYWDYGIHVPTSITDKFLYVRSANGTSTLQSLLYDIDDNYGTAQWTYHLWIDGAGNIHAPAYYIGNSSTPIGGGAGTIAEKLMTGAGSAIRPVYFRSDVGHVGEVAPIDYTIAKSVPANAVFTDTITTITTIGDGNAITSITADNGALTAAKDITFLTEHQDISGKADKVNTVTNINFDSTSGSEKFTKTINGSTIDIITIATLKNILGSMPASNVPSWAMQPNKPTYTASEIGALSDTTTIPTKVSDLINDAGFITGYTEVDPIFVASPAHDITNEDITNWNSKTNNTGTVTSITLVAGTGININNSNTAITESGTRTIGLASGYGEAENPYSAKTANYVLAGPTSGNSAAPSFRLLEASDIPNITKSKISDFPTTWAYTNITGAPSTLPNPNALTIKIYDGDNTPNILNYDGSTVGQIIEIANKNAIIGLSTSAGNTGETVFNATRANGDSFSFTAEIVASVAQSAASADKLNLSRDIGSYKQPVYFDKNTGLPVAIDYTIETSVPSGAKFTDTTYVFDGTYDASTNKAATVGTVVGAINSLNGGTIGSGATNKTITSLSQANGQVSAVFSNISITASQISDFSTAVGNATAQPASHIHGNIQNNGTLQVNDITIANNDKLVVTDFSDGGKIARANISFDGTTTNKALTPKGTWEIFSKFSGSYNDLTNKPTIPTLPSNIVNTITTTAGAHTTVSNVTGAVSFKIPTTAAHVGIRFEYSTNGNNRAVQQDNNGNLYVEQKDNDTNYYHTTGSWDGLTYKATSNGGVGALEFTLPTASTSDYGVTKLATTYNSTDGSMAVTGAIVAAAIGSAINNNFVTLGQNDIQEISSKKIFKAGLNIGGRLNSPYIMDGVNINYNSTFEAMVFSF